MFSVRVKCKGKGPESWKWQRKNKREAGKVVGCGEGESGCNCGGRQGFNQAELYRKQWVIWILF